MATNAVDERSSAGQMGPVLYQMVRNGRSFSGRERNCCFLNLGQGKFADVSSVAGFDFPDDGRAVGRCDWDLDGDIDLWIANRSGPQVRFLRNDFESGNHFLAIRLEGKDCNRDAIGARVEVKVANSSAQKTEPRQKLIQTLRAGEGFLAQSSKWVHFGLGPTTKVDQLVIHWPGGEKEVFDGLQVDRRYHIVEHSGKAREWNRPGRKVLIEPVESAQEKAIQRSRVVAPHPVPLPRLNYESFDGQEKLLGQPDGPLLINLWATWCNPCLDELAEFAKRENQMRDAGVDVIALSVDRLDAEKQAATTSAADRLQEIGFAGRAGWATAGFVEKLQLVNQHLFDLHQPTSVPTSLLIDANGDLVVLYRGPVSVEQVLEDVAQLPDVTTSPAALPFTGRWHTRRPPLDPVDIAWRMIDRGYLDDSIEYISRNKAQLAKSSLVSGLFVQVGTGLLSRGEAADAIPYFREAIEYNEDSFEAQNNLAWILATHPDESLRNGKEAVRHIEAAVAARPENAFSLLDTLAAAYAEDEQFEKAIATAQRAIEFATKENQHGFAKQIEDRVQLYKLGQPYRDK